MRTGRPPAGLDHVDVLQGDAMSKERLRVVFATLAGVLTIDQACSVLRISPSRFHALRQQALQGALTAIRPRRPGRPPKTPPTADAAWVARLEEEVTSLRTEVEAWRQALASAGAWRSSVAAGSRSASCGRTRWRGRSAPGRGVSRAGRSAAWSGAASGRFDGGAGRRR